jgi:transcription elongation factor GreA
VAAVGSLVTVTRIDTEAQTAFKLVGPREANATERKISVESPVGKELLGRRPGDEISVEVPSGVIAYRIDAVGQA